MLIIIMDAFVHQGIRSAGKQVEFLSDTISYIILRGRWYNILDVHAPNKYRSEDTKDCFYEEPVVCSINSLSII
jgi:hypothetical protein